MKFLVLLLSLTGIFSSASAGVLERIRLEDAVQSRVQKGLQDYDKNARVEISFSFRKNEALPGTTVVNSEDMQPTMVEEADISKINVKVLGTADQISPEIEDAVYRLIPVRKNRIKLTYEQLKVVPEPQAPGIKSEDLNNVTVNFAQLLSKMLLAIFGTGLLLVAVLALYMQQRSLRRSREHFDLLAKSFSENGGAAPFQAQDIRAPSISPLALESQVGSPVQSQVASLSSQTLQELFADCYWCERDHYAHWLWKQISPDQRTALIADVSFMRKYSTYFVSLPPRQESFHEHPYYLAPENLFTFSQEALSGELKKDPDLWNILSPMRQKSMSLPITDRLRLVQKTSASKKAFTIAKPSADRTLKPIAMWSDMSVDDERVIFQNPQLVPATLKRHVRSLVWLSLKDSQYITEKLATFDARTLASAWVGAPEVLEVLEKSLPEKKLKLLKDYLAKTPASRESSAYQALVDEGLMDEAA